MREARVYQKNQPAGVLRELRANQSYEFAYDPGYKGRAVSQTMPVREQPYLFEEFPPFFEGLLPEGYQLEALLRLAKLDRSDLFGQLLQVGGDLVGSVTVKPL